MKKFFAVLLTLMLLLSMSTAALAKPHETTPSTTSLLAQSTYTINLETPSYIVTNKDAAFKVTLKTNELGSAGYADVNYQFAATNTVSGTVYFTTTDSAGTHSYTDDGSWPAADFDLAANYNQTTNWNLEFTKAGQYDITFKAVKGSSVLAAETETVTVTDAAFVYTVPENVYANQEITVNVGFVTEQDYSNVHFDFAKTAGPGDAVFRAKDTNHTWYSSINSGYWGSGFNIDGPYDVTTPWYITFKSAGTYTINFQLSNSNDHALASGSATIVVKDPTAIDNDDEEGNDEEEIENGNTEGLLNALKSHKKVNHGAERIAELLLARGVSQSVIDEAISNIEAAITSEGATDEDYQALDKMHQQKGDKYSTYVDGKKVNYDVQPTLKNNRTLVPFKKIAEALGATVSYKEVKGSNGKVEQKITVTNGTVTVELTIGSNTALVNGQAKTLDVPAQIEKGRTLVPLRFLSTAFNTTVDFYQGSMIVIKKGDLK